ncbi:MAG: LacI family DNA-binding transcriptional regulator [Ancalomicrobiaceae bacterium]|nr:LacI family DNA-binding transcriptional regulator [Ancalomicrobiaceae bacterium]
MNEIAIRLGLSPSTVSRALKRPELVREETRAAILTAVKLAGYPEPPKASRSRPLLNTIGLMVPDLENPFFTLLAKVAATEARRYDCSLVIADTNEEPLSETEVIGMALRHVDGLLISSSRLDDASIRAAVADAPLILINRALPGVPSILIDNRRGMNQALEHLLALGHRKIAYVEGPNNSWSNRQRLETFRQMTGEDGAEGIVIGPYAPRFEGGVQAADVAIARRVSAVIAYNDIMAFGIISRLNSRGIQVPRDMSVVGFDDIPAASIWSPALTTIAAPIEAIAKIAIGDLMRAIRQQPVCADAPRQVASDMVIRASTGIYAADRMR